jgi:hypothetical protein
MALRFLSMIPDNLGSYHKKHGQRIVTLSSVQQGGKISVANLINLSKVANLGYS